MEKLVEKLAEILEIDDLDVTRQFTDYEEWDSLCSLSILAMLDSDYKTSMRSEEILGYATIEDFCNEVLSRQK